MPFLWCLPALAQVPAPAQQFPWSPVVPALWALGPPLVPALRVSQPHPVPWTPLNPGISTSQSQPPASLGLEEPHSPCLCLSFCPIAKSHLCFSIAYMPCGSHLCLFQFLVPLCLSILFGLLVSPAGSVLVLVCPMSLVLFCIWSHILHWYPSSVLSCTVQANVSLWPRYSISYLCPVVPYPVQCPICLLPCCLVPVGPLLYLSCVPRRGGYFPVLSLTALM